MRKLSFALRGIASAFAGEANMKIHAAAALTVIILAAVLRVSPTEWCLLLFAAGSVVSAELLNTAVERLCDRVTRERDDAVRAAKDIAAGAVLAAAVIAAAVGCIVFIPRIIDLLK
ncbi:MAG: diacylglycerol kinase family protein [Oscillospiraceae bacterium]|jgi:diacylglycerol kinase (ATP)|nr:diacylglycerol kinase family protein [Oscillospiraceae bacterium]